MNNTLVEQLHTQLYINGRWVQSSDQSQFSVINPASEEDILKVSSATKEDAISAVDAAFAAGPKWEQFAPRARAEVLRKAYALMMERKMEIATVISLEEGKTLLEALGEVNYAAEFFRWYSEEAVRDSGLLMRSPSGNNQIMVVHQPVGVCLLITPWNFPAAMATRKIAPALAAGCTVILKPASETPLTALLLAGLLEDAGVPAGVVNVIPSIHSSLMSETILDDSRVRKISFTGSTEIGRVLLKKASQRIVNCSMELGGNAPFIVLADADMDIAIESAMVAKMRNAGESCIGANRFYVHASIIEEFSSRLASEMAKLKVGDGLEKDIDVGPLVNEKTLHKVEQLVNQATTLGAKVLTGGKRIGAKGYFYTPTVIIDIPESADILCEEIFGPVASIVSFDNTQQVIAMANQTELGLAAYIMSRDIRSALNLALKIEAGVLGINRGFISDPAAPFGGVKQSGIGREGAQDGIHEFIEKKYIAIEW
jgi:succinate-semialdehyde dehydrogenase/glutarate-semialdehyde dehydrogenase